ncbi:MAG TPA: ABC transporter permease subunit, partial [Blastocatellia bacterium]|nr:ABC transporter permease subunit [Blastocatellia bacterium]
MTTARLQRITSLISARDFWLAGAVVVFVGVCVLPLLYMLAASFLSTDGGFTLNNYRRILSESRQRELLMNSAILGSATSLVATALGAPLGFLFARVNLPAKVLLRFALIIPLLLPPYILGLAWIYFSGSTGMLAHLSGLDALSPWTYSLTGSVAVLSVNLFPLAMLATEVAARRVDGRLEEAGLLAAGPQRVLTRITMPLVAPGILAAALVIFVLAISEFGVPGLLRVRVFTTEVFTAFAAQYDFGRATALSAPLLLLALVMAVLLRFVIGDKLLTTRRSTPSGLAVDLGRWRRLPLIWIAIVLGLSALL